MKSRNEKNFLLKLQRREVCDVLLALTLVSQESEAEKWRTLHDKIKEQLNAFDAIDD